MILKGKKILVGVSAGIAAYKISRLVRLLIKEGAEVRIVMTPDAAKFVSPVTLSALSKNDVIMNIFPDGEMKTLNKVETQTWHVNLGIWADYFIIAPATANTLAKIAAGMSDNFLLVTILATRCPIALAPTMDDDMYKNKITQSNINKLKSYGYRIIEPTSGELASGLVGMGRMAEPEVMLEFLRNELAKKEDLKGKKILVTAGPTREYIDAVRFITNPSTGKMGFAIAQAASERGADVTLISGPVNLSIENVNRIDVETSDQMFNAVKKNMKSKDAIVMTAAIEDFKPLKISKQKIKKENFSSKINIECGLSVDILKYLGDNKKNYKLVGFAVETNNEVSNAKSKLKRKNLDFIVLNNPNVKGAGFGTDTNVASIIDGKSVNKYKKMTKLELANIILDKLFLEKTD
ncbi:MAG: bifunctional phosphopantothenoylcysteine decarboxylase/phosphopantothenate--cysteine ligase CoaBC [Ignavibacteria bacterium]|nr:bifunctional phosphopantothenoylcysteine decarboxylase/phosphopantothenate--cysteine ligase CoaBC [Ignavibacteria bacterium]